ncbi:preprotein translocase subunit SecE [Cyanobium sp. FGCU-52]|nr:preprotein translocase subunit SecE [Cyanobium sp. FGCU52]
MRDDASQRLPPVDPATTPPSSRADERPEPALDAPAVAESPLGPEPEGGFIAATMDELRKVVWPSRQQLFSESVAVILMVGLSAAAIAAIDRFYNWLSLQVFR